MTLKSLATLSGLLVATALPALAGDREDAIKQAFSNAVPGLEVSSVTESRAPGLYRVQAANGQAVYATEDGRFLLTGDLLEVTDQGLTNVSEQARAEQRVAAMEAFGDEGVITYPASGEEKAVIDVFTDIDCPYCRKLHEEVPELNGYGITVNYYAFPRSGPGTASWAKYESVWCADDQRAAMDAAKAGERVANNRCDNPVEAQYRLGGEIGVTGTPAIVMEDGGMVPGYRPAAALARAMGVL
ncbi:MAG: thioredoxin fold domain-containing protein [Alteromonadaceae bacterium]|nr:thioredoxin fold domain-containing protein [Alteromonadaceae bacterium]